MGSQIFATPGTASFTVPPGVSVITVRCYGAGGRGGNSSRSNGRGGGGAGGNYAESILSVSAGSSFDIVVGNGCDPLKGESALGIFSIPGKIIYTVRATGGQSGQSVNSSTGALGVGGGSNAALCIGDIIRPGGAGGTGTSGGSGAGGGGAGLTGNGGNASTTTPGAGNSQGGNGAAGVSPAADGLNGDPYGGGGSGGANSTIQFTTRFGGCGGNGAVIIEWADTPTSSCICIYSNTNPIAVGSYLYLNPSLTQPAANGYYSNGTNCYTVTGGTGYVSSVNACASTAVNITACTLENTQFNPYATVRLYADLSPSTYSSNPITVTTTVFMELELYTSNGYFFDSDAYILNGTTDNSRFVNVGAAFTDVFNFFMYLTTFSGPNQTYTNAGAQISSTFIGCP